MKTVCLAITLFLANILSYSQEEYAGKFELGLRNTYSLFSHESEPGLGAGGQFRIRLTERINTEWFADLLKNDIGDLGGRTDTHIGWSVMFYPLSYDKKINPYLLAGHCFDYTKVTVFENTSNLFGAAPSYSVDRWSSAVQAGLGTSWNLSDRFNFSLAAQYMMHLGNDLHAEIDDHFGVPELHVHDNEKAGAEGHLLITLSMNFLVADLW